MSEIQDSNHQTLISLKRISLLTLIISLSISALLAIFFLLSGHSDTLEIRLLLTTLVIGLYSMTGLGSSILYERKQYVPFTLLGIVSSIVAALVTIGLIWEVINGGSAWKIIGTLSIIALAVTHCSLLLLLHVSNKTVSLLRLVTLLMIAIVSAMLILEVVSGASQGSFYIRVLDSIAVLDVLGTVVVPIANKISN